METTPRHYGVVVHRPYPPGVGILAKDSFLKLFTTILPLEVIWPGRAIKLKLRGPHGALDVIATYFHTGSQVTEHDISGVAPMMRDTLTTLPAPRAHLRSPLG